MTDGFFGSKGGGGSFTQRPDTLRSNDVFEGILGIAVGPLKGLTKGLKSQKLNGTFVEDASGVLNFKDMIIEVKSGDPALFPQPIIPALGSGGVPTSVNISLTNTDVTGSVPGDWVTRTMDNLNADFIDLRFIAEQLYIQDKSGIRELTANLEIQMKPTGLTTWINPILNVGSGTYNSSDGSMTGVDTGTKVYLPVSSYGITGVMLPESNNGYLAITGKTTSPYVKELRIRVPNQGAYLNKTWDIRVRLREPASIDADPNFTKRIMRWESISGGYSTPMGITEGWRGVASIRLYGKATDEFNGVPVLEGIWDTKIVSVPPIGVYNPDTRQYTGAVWDGSFSKAFTTDPAWIINDVLADGLFGMSSLAPESYLNKWDALEVSKWCSQLVWDGGSGTHPRYNLNFRSQAPQKANEFVQYLAGAIGGFAWDNGNGEWRIKLDKAEAPSDIITLETIDGEFAYSHTDISTRYNDITGTFLNEDIDYREDRVSVVNDPAIALYGRKPTTVVLVGCTNRQEAVRRITLRLRASLNETKMVNFTTNRRGRLLTPFSTVLIADGDLGYQLPTGSGTSTDLTPYNNRTTGRVVMMDPARTNITLRDSVRLELGVSYLLHFTIPNPNYNPTATSQPTDSTYDKPTLTTTRTISNSAGQRGDVNTLYLSAALPAGLPDSLAVAIEAAGLPSIPKMYRVLGVNVDDQNPERHTISCIEVDTGKQAAADAGVSSSASYQAPATVVPPPLPPSSGSILSVVRIPGAGANILNLVVNWQRPASLFLAGFRVQYRLNNGPNIVAIDGVQDTSFELVNPPEGRYAVEIAARDRRGSYSAPLTATLNVGTVVDNPFVANAQVLCQMFADKLVPATYLGVVAGGDLAALVWTPVVTLGGVTIKTATATTYAIINPYGGTLVVDNTAGSTAKGNITISAITGNTAGGDLVITVSGVAQPKIAFKVTKDPAAPPPTGGTTQKSASWSAGELSGTSSTSYVAIISPIKIVTVATGESIYGTAPFDVNVAGGSGAARTMTFKWRCRLVGSGIINDFGAGIVSSTGYGRSALDEVDAFPGYVEVTQSRTTPTPGDYEVWMEALASNSSPVCTPSGVANIGVRV